MVYYGVLLTFIFEYMRPGAVFGSEFLSRFNALIPLTTLALSLVLASKTSHAQIWSDKNTHWLLFLFFWMLLSVIVANVPESSWAMVTQVLGYLFLFYIISRSVDDISRFKGVIRVLAAVHLGMLAFNPELVTDPSVRHYITGGTFLGDGNDFALSVCLAFPLCLFLYLDAKSKAAKLVYMGVLVLLVMMIVGTQSRGATLGLVAALLYLWLNGRQRALGLVAIGMLGIAVVLFAAPEYYQRMGTITNYEADGSAQGRLHAWGAAINMATLNPLLGIGTGNFGFHNRGLTAHSMYFLALGELGVPGLIFIVGYLLSNFRRGRARVRELREMGDEAREYYRLFLCLTASLVGFSVAAAFLSALYYPHIFVIGALFLAAHKMYERKLLSREAQGADTLPMTSRVDQKHS